MNKKKPNPQMGFKQALTYVLDVLCYAYYAKSDNLVSDLTFDELEKLYCKFFEVDHAPNRANERDFLYTNGVRFIYKEFKRKINEI